MNISKLIDYIIFRTTIGLTFLALIFISVYFAQPVSLFFLSSLGINLEELLYFQDNEKLTEQLEKLKSDFKDLKRENRDLQNEISKVISEKEGFIKGLENIKIDSVNWFNVFKIITFVGVIGGVTYYFLFTGSDVTIFKPITKHITESTLSIINNNGQLSQSIVDSISILSQKNYFE
jgi:hypothetical protein